MDERTKGEGGEHAHLLRQYQHATSDRPKPRAGRQIAEEEATLWLSRQEGDEGWSDMAHNRNTSTNVLVHLHVRIESGGWPCYFFCLHHPGQSSRRLFLSHFFLAFCI